MVLFVLQKLAALNNNNNNNGDSDDNNSNDYDSGGGSDDDGDDNNNNNNNNIAWSTNCKCRTTATVHRNMVCFEVYSCIWKKEYEKHSIQVTSTSDSRIWGCVLGSIQGMLNKCFRPRSKQSG
jgi:hypothetical protein